MTELYIFSQNDELLTIITEDTGLVSAPYRIEVNSVPDTPFSFTIESDSENAEFVKDENKIVYLDHEGDLRLVVIKELDDSDSIDGPLTTATCEPEFMELTEHIVVDRRFTDRTAQFMLDAALEGTRYIGEVEVELGLGSTNFYYLTSVEAIWKIIELMGGEFKDVVEFDSNNNIIARKIKLLQRLGADTGQRLEIDHNITEIGRTVLSYPKTAMYGRGASLETEGGGNTRYIDFADVEWKKSNGDPVDKPLGQKWVGDPDALQVYGRPHNGGKLHRYGTFSNQDYEDPEELLWATWQNLQANKQPEVNYRLSVDLFDDKVSLGDTAIAIDRYFSRPIEIQARIIAMEYDLLDIEGTMIVEMGQFLNLEDDRLDRLEEKVDKVASRPQRVTENSYPDHKPSRPINVEAHGGREIIQLYWDYADELFIKHYEVYGSQVADFVPDTQHLLWRGQVSAFAHAVNTDETWYYYVRAVNYHGTPSDWSARVSASTTRIISDDILFGEDLAERLRELNRISDIIGENGVDFNQISEEAKHLLNQEARIYTDEEIGAVRSELNTKFEEYGNHFINIDTAIDDINGSLSAKVERGIFDEFTETVEYDMAQVNLRYDEISTTVSNIQIGGRNIVSNDSLSMSLATQNGYVYRLTKTGASNPYLRVSRNHFDANSNYIATFKVKKISGTVFSMAGHSLSFESAVIYRDGVKLSSSNWSSGDQNYPNDTDTHFYEVHFSTPASFPTDSAPYWYIQPNRSAYGENYALEIWDFQIEKGTKATDWTPAPEDIDQRMTVAESHITQLADDITLKVDVDNIVSEINLNREGVRIAGNLIHLDGLALIDESIIQTAHIANGAIEKAKLGTAIIDDAHIDEITGRVIRSKTITTDHLSVASLDAITGNMGTLSSGRLLSNNNNMDLNLNTGSLTMRNADFSLGGGANIRFTDRNNRLLYVNNSIYAGIQFDHSLGPTDNPMIGIGISDFSHNVNDPTFRGIRIHSLGVEGQQDYGTNIITQLFTLNNTADMTGTGFRFKMHAKSGSGNRAFYPLYTANRLYDLGTINNKWNNLFVDDILSNEDIDFRNMNANQQGFRMEVGYGGQPRMSFYGLSASNYYGLGKVDRPFSYGFINHLRPTGTSSSVGASGDRYNYVYTNSLVEGSDISIKDNISDSKLGLDFINDLHIVDFRMIDSGQYKTGVIAQELEAALINHGVDIAKQSMVFTNDDVMGVAYTQLISPLAKSVQELDCKLESEVTWLKTENQLQSNEIKILKNRLEKLEDLVA
ncbi:phage tail spike protein [Oceanobacillus profundus]|uniref:phage tail spike protein n=1 Tax=Oceanobacillus profundus TaxID=372463 RepID=UPI0026E154D6|nr:phage tail spike protein [Oceanobacillus profundus]MDO6451712.1 phage tail spike protein [Oceanobacillus profundus]